MFYIGCHIQLQKWEKKDGNILKASMYSNKKTLELKKKWI